MAQDRRRVDVWRRTGGTWECERYGAGDTVSLTAIGYKLAVDELYEAAGVGGG